VLPQIIRYVDIYVLVGTNEFIHPIIAFE
jgi:hypothetical protein